MRPFKVAWSKDWVEFWASQIYWYNSCLNLWIQSVYILLYFYRLLQGGDDPAIMFDVIRRQSPALSVFKPLFSHLIAADLIFPNLLFHAFEILRLVDVDSLFFLIITRLIHLTITLPPQLGDGAIQLRRFHQM